MNNQINQNDIKTIKLVKYTGTVSEKIHNTFRSYLSFQVIVERTSNNGLFSATEELILEGRSYRYKSKQLGIKKHDIVNIIGTPRFSSSVAKTYFDLDNCRIEKIK